MPNLFSPSDLSAGYLFNNEYNNLIFQNVLTAEGVELSNGQEIKIANNQQSVFLRLERGNDHLSVVRLKQVNILNEDYYVVDKSHSFITGQGFVVPLYEYAFVYLDLPIICDDIQTKPGSSDLWRKLQRRQGENGYNILVLNTKWRFRLM